MQNFVAWPLGLRIVLVLLLGLISARFINWAIYSWCYFPKQLGPWSPPPAASPRGVKRSAGRRSKSSPAPRRVWQDHLPVIGWFRLRGESDIHGQLYGCGRY